MANPRVSVIVPAFNAEAFLEECLSSLAAQTLEDIEVVCVNDGSTDSTLAIFERYAAADERFTILSKENTGYGDSLNQGIARATGEWVSILESDDFIEPDAYEVMVAAGERHGVDLVKADFFLAWTLGSYHRRFRWCDACLSGLVWPQCDREVFFRKPSIWSAIYRRSFLEAGDIACLPTPGASYQDAGFSFRAFAKAERVFLVNRAFVHYRQDNEASSVNSPAKALCVCDEYAGMLEWLDRHPELGGWLRQTTSRMRYDTYLWNYERLAPELRPSFLERMVEDFKAEDEAGISRPELFASGAWRYRRFIEESPELFEVMHERAISDDPGKRKTLEAYYERGGMPFVARAVARSLSDRISR